MDKKAAISTEAGKALARLLCFQMINNKLGLHAHHISGIANEQADTISRLLSTTQQELFAKYPSLRTYKQYHLGPEMRSLIWQALLSGRSPDWNVAKLKGHFSPANDTG